MSKCSCGAAMRAERCLQEPVQPDPESLGPAAAQDCEEIEGETRASA